MVQDASRDIDVLIGSDHYFDVVTHEVRRGKSGPVAMNTIFGWVVAGPTQIASQDLSLNNLITVESANTPRNSLTFEDNDQQLINELRKIWDTESVGIHDGKTDEVMFLKELTYDSDEKRYEVNLPRISTWL